MRTRVVRGGGCEAKGMARCHVWGAMTAERWCIQLTPATTLTTVVSCSQTHRCAFYALREHICDRWEGVHVGPTTTTLDTICNTTSRPPWRHMAVGGSWWLLPVSSGQAHREASFWSSLHYVVSMMCVEAKVAKQNHSIRRTVVSQSGFARFVRGMHNRGQTYI